MRVLVVVFRLALGVALGMLGLASSSEAGTLTIDFDLSGTVFNVGGNPPALVVVNGANGGAAGTARVVFTGVNALGMGTAMNVGATVATLNLPFVVNQPNFGSTADLTGAINVMLVGGARFSPSAPTPLAQFFRLDTRFGCVGTAMECATLDANSSLMVPSNATTRLNLPFVLVPMGIAMAGGATVTGAIAAPGLVITGKEVARAFVPEAPELGLLGLGLALLGAALLVGSRRALVGGR